MTFRIIQKNKVVISSATEKDILLHATDLRKVGDVTIQYNTSTSRGWRKYCKFYQWPPVVALTLVVLAFCTPANSAPVGTWTGPGPHACNLWGGCPLPWAMAQARDVMPPEVHDQIATQIAANRDGEPMQIVDGQSLVMNSFGGPTGPVAEIRPIIADLPAPEPGHGWSAKDDAGRVWRLINVHGCGNWQVAVGQPRSVIAAAVNTVSPAYITRPGRAATVNVPTVFRTARPGYTLPAPEPIPPIPLPGSAWLLLAALVAVILATKCGRLRYLRRVRLSA